MSEFKKRGLDERDSNLKRADQKKSHGSADAGSSQATDLFGSKKLADKGMVGSNIKVKKKLPLVVDIIVGILMLAIVCGVIVGSYMLFRYYTNDYETRNVTYTVVFSVDEDIKKCAAMKNGELFLDEEGNSVYFGKIREVLLPENADTAGEVVLIVNASVKYRSGEGYFIGDSRMAVGSVFTLRHVESSYTVTVVDIYEAGGK